MDVLSGYLGSRRVAGDAAGGSQDVSHEVARKVVELGKRLGGDVLVGVNVVGDVCVEIVQS
jgi:hypothetical protein